MRPFVAVGKLDRNDSGAAGFGAMAERVKLDCKLPGWMQLYRKHATQGEEVDLVRFKCDDEIDLCQRIAAQNGMSFRIDSRHDTAFLRKPRKV